MNFTLWCELSGELPNKNNNCDLFYCQWFFNKYAKITWLHQVPEVIKAQVQDSHNCLGWLFPQLGPR